MNHEEDLRAANPEMDQAISELKERISTKYPGTEFAVQQGIDDADETWLVAKVDIEDPDEVVDLVVDRLLELQVDEQVPLYVLPVHTDERIADTLNPRRRSSLRLGHLSRSSQA